MVANAHLPAILAYLEQAKSRAGYSTLTKCIFVVVFILKMYVYVYKRERTVVYGRVEIYGALCSLSLRMSSFIRLFLFYQFGFTIPTDMPLVEKARSSKQRASRSALALVSNLPCWLDS